MALSAFPTYHGWGELANFSVSLFPILKKKKKKKKENKIIDNVSLLQPVVSLSEQRRALRIVLGTL